MIESKSEAVVGQEVPSHEALTALAPSIEILLRGLSAGACGPILMALGPGPLRMGQLTGQLSAYASRTIYRHAADLTTLDLVDREEDFGGSSRVDYRLTEPGGDEVVGLLDAYLKALVLRGDGGETVIGWKFLSLLGEMWGLGWIDELSQDQEGRSATSLAETTAGLTFHQVNRRVQILQANGLVMAAPVVGRSKRYGLSAMTRQGMAMVAGLGRWRQDPRFIQGNGGLAPFEMDILLRVSLPLITLAGQTGKVLKLGITAAPGREGGESRALLVTTDEAGHMHYTIDTGVPVDAWAIGSLASWFGVLLDGNRGLMRTGGSLRLVDGCLKGLYQALWN